MTACGPSPTPTAAVTPTATAAVAEATDGHVHLVVELATTRVRVGEKLTGTATLSLDGIDRLDGMTSSGGPFMVTLAGPDGSTRALAAGPPDLRQFSFTRTAPIVSQIGSLAVNWWDAPAALTPGRWSLQVQAFYFTPGSDPGNKHELKATIPFDVLG